MKETDSFSFDPEIEALLQARLDELRLIDDIFFKACLKDNPRAAEAIIRVALDMPNAKVESLSIQDESAFPNSRNVRFDLKVRDEKGRLFDVEVQRGIKPDLPRRCRYHLSALTVHSLRQGQDFIDIPDAYVLFLCETDPFDEGKPFYSFQYSEEKTGMPLDDGSEIRLFNCAYKGDDAYGRLALDMLSHDSARMCDPVLRDTVHRGKIGERRTDVMSDLAQELVELGEKRGYKKGAEQRAKEIALALLKREIDPEVIAEATGLPLETVLSLKK